jgi:hypothetical protein
MASTPPASDAPSRSQRRGHGAESLNQACGTLPAYRCQERGRTALSCSSVVLFHWILQSPLRADGIHCAHDSKRFVERHDLALTETGAQAAHGFQRLELIAIPVKGEMDRLVTTPPTVRGTAPPD